MVQPDSDDDDISVTQSEYSIEEFLTTDFDGDNNNNLNADDIRVLYNIRCGKIVLEGDMYRDKGDYERMILCYKSATEMGCIRAMNRLGQYHYNITNDYDSMMIYYNMAINLDDPHAMYNLGEYYKSVFDFQQMVKYFAMAFMLSGDYHRHCIKDSYDNIKMIFVYEIFMSLLMCGVDNDFVKNEINGYIRNSFYKNVYDSYNENKTFECCVCLNEENTHVKFFQCPHSCCINCFGNVCEKCPLCRAVYNVSQDNEDVMLSFLY